MPTPARLLVSLALALFISNAATTTTTGFTESVLKGGFQSPTAVAFLPDGRLLVTELAGGLHLVNGGSSKLVTTIPVASCSDYETGLLGIAVDPDFTNNHYVYLYRTMLGLFGCFDSFGRFNEVVRIVLAANDTVDLGTLTVLLTGIQTDTGYHCGGALRIGSDHNLYIGVGDTGNGDFQEIGPGDSLNPYAQDLGRLEGKILRIAPDGTIPADNPFVGVVGAREEVFARGFRNPFRIAWDDAGGRLWACDVGEEDFEEIDLVLPGANYGWPQCESKAPKGCAQLGETAPALVYPHAGGKSLGTAITAAGFAPADFGFMGGMLFFGDFESGKIWRIALNEDRTAFVGSPGLFVKDAAGPVDLAFGPDGSMVYVAFLTGEIRKVTPPASGGTQPLAGKKLSLKGNDKKSLQAQCNDLVGIGGGLDNPLVVGGSVRVVGNGLDDTYPLPKEAWSFQGKAPDKVKGFVYKDPKKLLGPITSVTITAGKMLKVQGSGPGLGHTITETDPGPVSVIVQIGGRKLGTTFGGTTKLNPNKEFSAKDAPAPVTLP